MHAIPNQQLTDTKTSSIDPPGILFYRDERIYRLVQNGETATALTIGQVCAHKLSDGVDMFKKVYIPLTANLSVLGGVIMAVSLAALSYGWIQVLGVNTQVSISGATTGGTDIAAGDYLKGANSAVYAIRDAATSPIYGRNLQAIDAVVTTTTPAAALKKAYVRCYQ